MQSIFNLMINQHQESLNQFDKIYVQLTDFLVQLHQQQYQMYTKLLTTLNEQENIIADKYKKIVTDLNIQHEQEINDKQTIGLKMSLIKDFDNQIRDYKNKLRIAENRIKQLTRTLPVESDISVTNQVDKITSELQNENSTNDLPTNSSNDLSTELLTNTTLTDTNLEAIPVTNNPGDNLAEISIKPIEIESELKPQIETIDKRKKFKCRNEVYFCDSNQNVYQDEMVTIAIGKLENKRLILFKKNLN